MSRTKIAPTLTNRVLLDYSGPYLFEGDQEEHPQVIRELRVGEEAMTTAKLDAWADETVRLLNLNGIECNEDDRALLWNQAAGLVEGLRGELDEARGEVAKFQAMSEADIAERRAAERRLAEALDLLRDLEWSFRQTSLQNGGTIYTASLCPACMGEKDPPDDKGSRRRRGDPLPPAGHRPGCRFAALLSASPPPASGTPGNEG